MIDKSGKYVSKHLRGAHYVSTYVKAIAKHRNGDGTGGGDDDGDGKDDG